jgi:hypothetical protein
MSTMFETLCRSANLTRRVIFRLGSCLYLYLIMLSLLFY